MVLAEVTLEIAAYSPNAIDITAGHEMIEGLLLDRVDGARYRKPINLREQLP